MVTHIVIFTWTTEATDGQINAAGRALDGLAAELSNLVTIRHGRDLGYRDGNGDYALVANFADKAGWDAYQSSPGHKAFVADFIAPIQASRLTIQF